MATSTAEPSRFYLPELDGLRCIAFLLVFIHHAPALNRPALLFLKSAGWIGVDLFFTLSAFLFVKLLAKEFGQTGTISIRAFYIRRALRIYPLYFVFCALVIALTSLDGNLDVLFWRGLGLVTFTDNILASYEGYNPIDWSAHLWTISYEEQFYLVIPLLLLFLFKSSRSRIIASLLAVSLLLTLTRALFIRLAIPHPAIWVLPVTHFESIILGIVVGLGGFNIFSRVPALLVLLAGVFSSYLITRLGAIQQISWKLIIEYWLIGVSTSLTVYFVFRMGKTRWMKWLSFGPIVFLGKISYGLYVYHLMGIALGQRLVERINSGGSFHSLSIFAASLAITVAFAWASYQVIEKPALRSKRRFEIIASRPA